MFLKRIEIENVRSLRELTLSTTISVGGIRRWTMLIGENGTGKSTLLRSIGLVLAGSEALPEIIGEPSSWVRSGARSARIEAELVTADGRSRRVALQIRAKDGLAEVIRNNHKALADLDDAISSNARNFLVVGYGVSRRIEFAAPSLRKEESIRHPRARSLATLFRADADLNSLESWAMDLEYRLGARGTRAVKSTLEGLLPDVSFLRIDRRKRRLLFQTPDGVVPLAFLSDGYQNVAAWVGDLLYRITETFKDYRRPLQARGLLLIDEIELHLHPVWQRRLRRFLTDKLPNFQIVATTHAALTAQQAGENELFYLRRSGRPERPQLFAYPGDPQKLMVHQLLLSDVFGLPTLSSPQVEDQRDRYQSLKAKRRRTPKERRELGTLAAQLRDLPDWTRETKLDREKFVLLKEVRGLLGARKGPGGRLAAGPARQQQTTLVKGARA